MKISKLKKSMLIKIISLLPASLLAVSPAFATKFNPGTSAGTWLETNVNGLIPGLIGVVAIFLLAKRDWPKALSAFGLALLAAALMNWTSVKSISTSIISMLTGG